MGALLGVDLGTVRVGIAVSDEMGMIASPLTVLDFKSRKQLIEALLKIISEYRVTEVVVGLPKTLKGEESFAAERVRKHVDWFRENSEMDWILWDERMSTKEVERVLIQADVSRQTRKEVRDKLAAQRILQNYIESQRNEEK